MRCSKTENDAVAILNFTTSNIIIMKNIFTDLTHSCW